MSKGSLNRSSGDPFGRKHVFDPEQIPRAPMARTSNNFSAELRYLISELQTSHKEDTQRWNYWTEQLIAESKMLNRTFLELVQQNNVLLSVYIKDVRIAELKATHWEAHARNAWALLEGLGQSPPLAPSVDS